MDFLKTKEKVRLLTEKGVTISKPATVDIGEDVDLDRISDKGVVIYSGCKIYGKSTLIMSGAKLGYEAPVTIEDCQIGPDVELKGGFFRKSVFLEKSTMGSCAQVRDACILEEEANGAHSVGLKHTILFPFVTLGSLINFCDCLMSGGTSRKNHSEVGSSYIHFNYTPNQDKATPSLIGDVPKGVMLDQPPIFLGGQGGLVGPTRIGFGTLIAAGVIFRGNSIEDNKFVGAKEITNINTDFYPGLYRNIARRVINNINYIANIIALRFWYIEIRSLFFQETPMGNELYKGALQKLDLAVNERIKRLRDLVHKLPKSIEIYQAVMKERAYGRLIEQKKELANKWPEIEDIFYTFREKRMDSLDKTAFLEKIASEREEKGNNYINVIQGLNKSWCETGTDWLKSIVNQVNREVLEKIPSFQT